MQMNSDLQIIDYSLLNVYTIHEQYKNNNNNNNYDSGKNKNGWKTCTFM